MGRAPAARGSHEELDHRRGPDGPPRRFHGHRSVGLVTQWQRLGPTRHEHIQRRRQLLGKQLLTVGDRNRRLRTDRDPQRLRLVQWEQLLWQPHDDRTGRQLRES